MRASSETLRVAEEIPFRGHMMVRATHSRTIEITTERHLTLSGDCIIGVAAAKGVAQLSSAMKSALRSDQARVMLTVMTPAGEFTFAARGSSALLLENPTDMVIRMSDFVCGRTLAVRAESSAREIPRELVKSLKSPQAVGLLRIEVYV